MENVVIGGCQTHVDLSRSAEKEWLTYKMEKFGGPPPTPSAPWRRRHLSQQWLRRHMECRDTEFGLRRSASPSASPHETTQESLGMENLVLSPDYSWTPSALQSWGHKSEFQRNQFRLMPLNNHVTVSMFLEGHHHFKHSICHKYCSHHQSISRRRRKYPAFLHQVFLRYLYHNFATNCFYYQLCVH